ncbi:MAG: diguanylate cyclase, partial [Betaproteobacteria bacterium]|nr:diguanylate cyclase [Betaproteobacteria bacterium]
DTLLHQAEIVANKLMQAARDPILVTDHSHRSVEVQLTVSMGVSATEMFEPAHSTTLLIAADRMLYQSKAAGGNQITSVSGQEETHGQ